MHSEALVEAAARRLTQHPSSPLHPSLSALPISLSVVCWLRYSCKHRPLGFTVRKDSRPQCRFGASLWMITLHPWSCRFAAPTEIMERTGVWGIIRQTTGSPANSPDWCRLGRGAMGCTTSAVVFDGLRSVLERNCSGYICKEAAESAGPSEAERALSRRESRALPAQRILKVCWCWGDSKCLNITKVLMIFCIYLT